MISCLIRELAHAEGQNRGADRKEFADVRLPVTSAFMDIYTNNPLGFGSRSLMLHALDSNLTGLAHSGGEILEFDIAPDRIKARQPAAVGDMVRQTPELTARDTGDHRPAAITGKVVIKCDR